MSSSRSYELGSTPSRLACAPIGWGGWCFGSSPRPSPFPALAGGAYAGRGPVPSSSAARSGLGPEAARPQAAAVFRAGTRAFPALPSPRRQSSITTAGSPVRQPPSPDTTKSDLSTDRGHRRDCRSSDRMLTPASASHVFPPAIGDENGAFFPLLGTLTLLFASLGLFCSRATRMSSLRALVRGQDVHVRLPEAVSLAVYTRFTDRAQIIRRILRGVSHLLSVPLGLAAEPCRLGARLVADRCSNLSLTSPSWWRPSSSGSICLHGASPDMKALRFSRQSSSRSPPTRPLHDGSYHAFGGPRRSSASLRATSCPRIVAGCRHRAGARIRAFRAGFSPASSSLFAVTAR